MDYVAIGSKSPCPRLASLMEDDDSTILLRDDGPEPQWKY